jgi:hypothetical protein
VRLKLAIESASVSERQNWQTRACFVFPEVAFHCGIGLRRIVHNESSQTAAVRRVKLAGLNA